MENPSDEKKNSSIVAPNNADPNYGGMGDIIYPPQTDNHFDSAPPMPFVQNIPINTVIGRESLSAYCYYCEDYRLTNIKSKIGHKICCCFFILMVSFPILSPIPFCVSSCYDTAHICPKCKKIMARYKP